MASLGILKLEILEAKFTRSNKLVRAMDPYVELKSRDQTFTTTTADGQDKNPKWENQVFEIDVKYMGDDIDFVARDNDPGRDEMIGKGDAKISSFCIQKEWDEWYEIEHKGKRWGKIHFKSTWEPAEDDDEDEDTKDLIRELADKKKSIQEKLNDARDRQERH